MEYAVLMELADWLSVDATMDNEIQELRAKVRQRVVARPAALSFLGAMYPTDGGCCSCRLGDGRRRCGGQQCADLPR